MAGVRIGSRDYRGGRYVEAIGYYLDNEHRKKQTSTPLRRLNKDQFRNLLLKELSKREG